MFSTISRLGELARESRLGMEVLPDWRLKHLDLLFFYILGRSV